MLGIIVGDNLIQRAAKEVCFDVVFELLLKNHVIDMNICPYSLELGFLLFLSHCMQYMQMLILLI